MQEYDGVALLEELLGAGSASIARREVVDESDGVALEWHGGAARCDTDNFARTEYGVALVGDEGGEA